MMNQMGRISRIVLVAGFAGVCFGALGQQDRRQGVQPKEKDWCLTAERSPSETNCFNCFLQLLDVCDNRFDDTRRLSNLFCGVAAFGRYTRCIQGSRPSAGERPEMQSIGGIDLIGLNEGRTPDRAAMISMLDFVDALNEANPREPLFVDFVLNSPVDPSRIVIGTLAHSDGGLPRFAPLTQVTQSLAQSLAGVDEDDSRAKGMLAAANRSFSAAIDIGSSEVATQNVHTLLFAVEDETTGGLTFLMVLPVTLSDPYDLNGDNSFDNLDRIEAINRQAAGEMSYDEMQKILDAER